MSDDSSLKHVGAVPSSLLAVMNSVSLSPAAFPSHLLLVVAPRVIINNYTKSILTILNTQFYQ